MLVPPCLSAAGCAQGGMWRSTCAATGLLWPECGGEGEPPAKGKAPPEHPRAAPPSQGPGSTAGSMGCPPSAWRCLGMTEGCLERLSWGTPLLFCADPAQLPMPALGLAPAFAECQGLQG